MITCQTSFYKMSHEESSNNENQSDINGALKEILSELKGQKRELNSLKEEVRENSLSSGELKKLKNEKDIKWKFEGNRLQYEFNSDIEAKLKQVDWAVKNQKLEYASELCTETYEKMRVRNKLIRMADSSEGGWATVQEYESNPLASDSEDESRIFKAESRAIKKRKHKSDSKKKSKPAAAYGFSDSARHIRGFGTQPSVTGTGNFYGGRTQSFRGYQPLSGITRSPAPFPIGPCFACGESTHLRRSCPYTNKDYKPDLPTRK